ncbi:hypothetical protein HELRODRAFT_162692 [Helobdella robusta]|uniref:Uncharacterized protein n=1 Tax=Helobdella robusta TaxID=6412 RepID=T1ET08_HELRO|nr:hypothetical protein HELRODRAFT_162692 [Helobdella robusta]ESN99189.1 hypothetical protein HELRODRAFT_162692 [Helobdella robusta]
MMRRENNEVDNPMIPSKSNAPVLGMNAQTNPNPNPSQTDSNEMMTMMSEQLVAIKGMMMNMMEDMGSMKARINKMEEKGRISSQTIDKDRDDTAVLTPKGRGLKNRSDKRKKDDENLEDLIQQDRNKKSDGLKEVELDEDRHIEIMERYAAGLYRGGGEGVGADLQLTEMELHYAETHPINLH